MEYRPKLGKEPDDNADYFRAPKHYPEGQPLNLWKTLLMVFVGVPIALLLLWFAVQVVGLIYYHNKTQWWETW